MFEEPKIELDREKLKDIVHYICSKATPSELGNVKLHKILYFSDMLHFKSTGLPLSGVEYQKQQFGPVAKHLTWAIEELTAQKRIRVETRDYFGFSIKQYISLAPPKMDKIGNATKLLDDVIEFVCVRSAREISELSHNLPWQMAKMGETIPYYTVLGWQPTEITDEDMQWAVTEARRIAPRIEAEFGAT